jgi:stearoyl-CoA desaturase (delta-9 desaturase)
MHSAKQGFFWWEIDLSYYGLKILSWLGLVWDLRGVPGWALEGRTRRGAETTTLIGQEEPTADIEQLAA